MGQASSIASLAVFTALESVSEHFLWKVAFSAVMRPLQQRWGSSMPDLQLTLLAGFKRHDRGVISRSGPHHMRVKGHSCVDSHRRDISGSISLGEALRCKSYGQI